MKKIWVDRTRTLARELFFSALKNLNCNYEIDEDNPDRIVFGYQGGQFEAIVLDNRAYIYIRYPFWLRISRDDIDEMARVRKVINEANINCHTTVVYTVWEQDNSFNVHTTSQFIFCLEIPDVIGYLRAELDSFFHTSQYIYVELEKLRAKEREAVMNGNV